MQRRTIFIGLSILALLGVAITASLSYWAMTHTEISIEDSGAEAERNAWKALSVQIVNDVRNHTSAECAYREVDIVVSTDESGKNILVQLLYSVDNGRPEEEFGNLIMPRNTTVTQAGKLIRTAIVQHYKEKRPECKLGLKTNE